MNRTVKQLPTAIGKDCISRFVVPAKYTTTEAGSVGLVRLQHVHLLNAPELLELGVFRPGMQGGLARECKLE